MKTNKLISDFEENKMKLLNKLEELEGRWREMVDWMYYDGFPSAEDFFGTIENFGLDEDEMKEMRKNYY